MAQQTVSVDTVVIPSYHQGAIDEGTVRKLMVTMKLAGLLYHIVIDGKNNLVAGRHRLEAAKRLKWQVVACVVKHFDSDDEAELCSLSENLDRRPFTEADMVRMELRRSEIRKKLSPNKFDVAETEPTAPNPALEDFLSDEDTGKRTRQRRIAIGSRLEPEALAKLPESPIADSQKQIDALSRVPKDEQVAVLEKIASGEAVKVEDVATPAEPRKYSKGGRPKIDIRAFAGLRNFYGKMVRANTATYDAVGEKEYWQAIKKYLDDIHDEMTAWEDRVRKKQLEAGNETK